MALQKKYKIILETRLEQLWHQGFCVLERWELAAWFNKDRITNVVWREIQETWDDLLESDNDSYPLSIIRCDETTTPQQFVVIRSDRVKEMSEMV